MKNKFTAERISKSAGFIVDQNIEKLFPLYGPIEEMKWAHGWSPDVIYSNNTDYNPNYDDSIKRTDYKLCPVKPRK
jgi:hypothetical protein